MNQNREPRLTILPEHLRKIRTRLTRWYDRCARDLPWRRIHDPYAVWIAEIMLQQTQVETVKDYYRRFLRRFPDIERLARARRDTVLKLWEGLGYYSRARHLHETAKILRRDHHGRLPRTVAELMTLPGIGRYTAGAIASIAFDQKAPILDGNVTRVLCRLFRIDRDPRLSPVNKQLWSLADELVPAHRPGCFNQAMMELGAMICLPRRPLCASCPLAELCLARRNGQQDALPEKTAKKTLPHHTIVIGIIHKNGKILIDRRPEKGLLGGLWEFPGGKQQKNESRHAALRREVREELGIEIKVIRPLATVKHAYSHFRITLHAFECRHRSGRPRALACDAWKWVAPRDLTRYAFPRANQKILPLLTKVSNK